MDDKLICPICGRPTRSYMGHTRNDGLCGFHADQLKSGAIEINKDGLFCDSKTKKILNFGYKETEVVTKQPTAEKIKSTKKIDKISNDNLICPICGMPTRSYMGHARKDRLCGTHADQLKSGAIEINKDGLFCDSKTKKILNSSSTQVQVDVQPSVVNVQPSVVNEQPATVDEQSETIRFHEFKQSETGSASKCIACGKPTSSGFFFCKECYAKYKNKKLLVEIRNCVEINILDDSYEGVYKCDDGHVVKSKSELIIDNYLFERGIPHAYEKAFPIDANPAHDLYPDFYIPSFNGVDDIYLEHWGFNENNVKYWKSKKYKIDKYIAQGITLICTNEKDMSDPKTALKRKLEYFKPGIINFDD